MGDRCERRLGLQPIPFSAANRLGVAPKGQVRRQCLSETDRPRSMGGTFLSAGGSVETPFIWFSSSKLVTEEKGVDSPVSFGNLSGLDRPAAPSK
jgi:hypothetical protein